MTESRCNFDFPLNVYTRVLELETGGADYLHYGLFETPSMPLAAAQARSTALLWQHLPPPCQLLEVGVGLGTTLARLTQAGYGAVGISPDAAQIAHVAARQTLPLATRCCRLEDFMERAGQWDALLFQESGQYIDPIDLFEQASQLLAEHGEILLLDEFALRRETPGTDNLHLLPDFLALAGRFGFSIEVQIDLSAQAAPTVDWLLYAVEKHAALLKADLGVTQEQLNDLNQSNRRYQANYGRGIYGYFLLKLRRTKPLRWRVGRLHSHNAVEMRSLFSEVFGHEMSAAHWQWKYGNERGCGMGVWRTDGRIVAHYGGVGRKTLMFGQPVTSVQVGDVMVSVDERGTLSRKGPIFLATATFLEQELGFGRAHLLGFGFPSETAYRVAERLGLYGRVGFIQSVTWPTHLGAASLSTKVRSLDRSDAANADTFNRCWQGMANDLGNHVAGVRDASYMQHRYTHHPEKQYRVFVVSRRLSGRTLGLFVLRETQPGVCELLDVVGPLTHIPLLVRQARRVAAAWGCKFLFAWLTDNILSEFDLPADASVKPVPVVVPCNIWTAGPDKALVDGKWWLTGGDTDFH